MLPFRTKEFSESQDLGRVDRQACAKGRREPVTYPRGGFGDHPDARSFGPIGDEEAGLPLVLSKDGHLYFRRHFEYERQIARALALRLARPSADPDPAALDFFRQALAPQVDEHQALAVGTAMRKDLLLLTGGRVRSKTRTIVIMLAALLQAKPKLRVALAAPTGKVCFPNASLGPSNHGCPRFTDTIRTALVDCAEATLHRLLGWQSGSVDFKRNAKNTLLQDLVILDEASMVDLPMMAKFCTALRDEAKLVLAGDSDSWLPCRVDRFSTAWFEPMSPIVFPNPTWRFGKLFFLGEEAGPEDRFSGTFVSLAFSHRREGSRPFRMLGDLCDAIRDGEGESALKIVRESNDDCIRLIESLGSDQVDSTLEDEFKALSEASDPQSALGALAGFRILSLIKKAVMAWSRGIGERKGSLSSEQDRPSPIVVGVNDYVVRLFNGDDGIILGKKAHFAVKGEYAKSWFPDCGAFHLLCDHYP